MITAQTIRLLSNLGTASIQEFAGRAGRRLNLVDSQFIGLTNGEQFCYWVKHTDENVKSNKVFLWEDPETAKICVDF